MARYKIKSVANGKYVSRTDMRVQSYALLDACTLGIVNTISNKD